MGQFLCGSVGHGPLPVTQCLLSDTPQEGVNPVYRDTTDHWSAIYVVPQIGRTSLILAPLYIKRAVDTAVSVRIMLIKDVVEIDHEILMQYLNGRPNWKIQLLSGVFETQRPRIYSPSRSISADKERRTKKRTKIPSKKLFNTFHIAVKMYSDFCNVSKLYTVPRWRKHGSNIGRRSLSSPRSSGGVQPSITFLMHR